MRTSVYLAASGLALALAGPVAKRDVVTVTATDVTVVTVTAPAVLGAVFQAVTEEAAPSTAEAITTSSELPLPSSSSSSSSSSSAPSVVPTAPSVVPSPSKTAAQKAAAEPTDFASTAVFHHNLHRENNSAPALEWDSTYAGYAGQTAAKCKFAHDMVPGNGGYGQNLAMWGSSGDAKSLGEMKAIARAITNMWYNGEIVLYPEANYEKPNPVAGQFEQYGHYTQMVWASTSKVGCAAQYCPPGTMFTDMGAWFSVCNYFPAGNMGGKYGENVLRPLGKATVSA